MSCRWPCTIRRRSLSCPRASPTSSPRPSARIAEADAGRTVPDADLAKLGTAARRRLAQARASQADVAVQAAIEDLLPEVERQLAVILTPDERNLLASGRFGHTLEEGLVLLVREAYSRRIARDLKQLREAAELVRQPGEPARVVLRTGSGAPDRVLPNLALFEDVPGAAAPAARQGARAAAPVAGPGQGRAGGAGDPPRGARHGVRRGRDGPAAQAGVG